MKLRRPVHSARPRGWGKSLRLQGGFLLLFDTVPWVLNSRLIARLAPAPRFVRGDAHLDDGAGPGRHAQVADARDEKAPDSNPGLGNVDPRGTPFAAAPGEFVAIGYYGSGGATYSANNQVVDLWNRGECGWMSVQGADHPFNGRGAQLQYAPPPA